MKYLLVVLLFLGWCLSSLNTIADTLSPKLTEIQHQWINAYYQLNTDEKLPAYQQLLQQTEQLNQLFPNTAEPKIWQALVLSCMADHKRSFASLAQIKKARELLLEAEKINAQAQQGLIYTLLGSLYSRAPRWPISFGDAEQARMYFEKSLNMNRNSIDTYFFYAELLYFEEEYSQAMLMLNKALATPPYPGFEAAYYGRQKEVLELKEKIRKLL